jgi:pimeloyl-ACP methyl ester carboxylesterase
VLELPSFRETSGSFSAYEAWLREELRARCGPLVLGGHSFGAALAVLAAAREDVAVEHLILVDPAGLPLSKPFRLCLRDFAAQLLTGVYPLRPAAESIVSTICAPRSALRLARSVCALDLRRHLLEIRCRGLPCTTLAASTDTLTPPSHCREIATFAGGEFHELAVSGGHVWFLVARSQFRESLALERIAPGQSDGSSGLPRLGMLGLTGG